eukprot:CAMPEP_0194273572 /NCGR_PEP_ID=MMETSP0169-20130528/6882_1 /TAXON_ID=218684 /ORGANISM="Corethron pennatum, Strain L29A3" /LENGTH=454 /DNA_ID=CAMNT_0039016563 /DNA_START=265 /DNA_END=1632 /DNA_ORIENTATION=+
MTTPVRSGVRKKPAGAAKIPLGRRDRHLPGLSACLLIKDDNDRLTEWMAYHFVTMPLRYLIVGVDPKSKKSPSKILEWWNGQDGLKIIQWDDDDYMTEAEKEKGNRKEAGSAHIDRQKIFYRECINAMVDAKRSWTMAIDTDEFFVFNKYDAASDPPSNYLYGNFHEEEVFSRENREDMLFNWTEWEDTRIDWFSDWIKKIARADRNGISRNPILDKISSPSVGNDIPRSDMEDWELERSDRSARLVEMRKHLPHVGEMTVEEYIHLHRNDPPFFDRTMYLLPRLFFSSHPTDPARLTERVPDGYYADNYQTLKYTRHAKKGHYRGNCLGKTFMDVSRLSKKLELVSNVHALANTSVIEADFHPYQDSMFRVHHYLGSWESYSYRVDSRRSKVMYDGVNNLKEYDEDYDIRPWLEAFVEEYGENMSDEVHLGDPLGAGADLDIAASLHPWAVSA